jgi:glucose/mannose-6-phosphate isomerase
MGKDESARHFRVDVDGMHQHVASFPDQVEWMWGESADFNPGFSPKSSPLLICGMGGSAIGGRLLGDLAGSDKSSMVYVNNGYTFPAYFGKDANIICVSYSGNTEEVISCYNEAVARKCNVAVITSGGDLLKYSIEKGVPLLKLPPGLPPRAAIGYLFTAILRIASRSSIFRVDEQELQIAVARARRLVDKYSIESNASRNDALNLARKLYGKIAFIYCGDGLMRGISYRWRCQFNENAKTMAFDNNFPELGHNEIMGWKCPEKFRENFFLILLRDTDDHPRIKKRMEVTYQMLKPLAGAATIIESCDKGEEQSRLSRLFSMLMLGDFTSVYLAVEYGNDPTPVEMIEDVKEKLRMENQ